MKYIFGTRNATKFLGPFWKALINIEQLKSLMVLSLPPKNSRALNLQGILEFLGNIITFELKILSTWLRQSLGSSYEHLITYIFYPYSTNSSKVMILFVL